MNANLLLQSNFLKVPDFQKSYILITAKMFGLMMRMCNSIG